MQYTDNEAALIGGLISTYFFQPAVSASLKDAYSRVLEHLHQNALTSSDLQQIRKAVNFLMPMCQANRQTQRELMGVNARTTALLNGSRYFAVGKSHKNTDETTYKRAWAEYWERIHQGCPWEQAIGEMCATYGGVARKHPQLVLNAFYNHMYGQIIDWALEAMNVEPDKSD